MSVIIKKKSWRLLLNPWLGDRKEMEKPRSCQGQQPQTSSSSLRVTASAESLQKRLNGPVCA